MCRVCFATVLLSLLSGVAALSSPANIPSSSARLRGPREGLVQGSSARAWKWFGRQEPVYSNPLAAKAAADVAQEAEDATLSTPVMRPVSAPVSGAVDVLSSALAWQQSRDQQQVAVAQTHDLEKVGVSEASCGRWARKLGNSAVCSMVTEISGYPEGCECRVRGKSCSDSDHRSFGFTGMTPSAPFSVGDESRILCMFWHSPPQKLSEDSSKAAEAKKASVRNAQGMVKAAQQYARVNAKMVADPLWLVTPTPFPQTPPPASCAAGELVANPWTQATVSYGEIPHAGFAAAKCPEGYTGDYVIGCHAGVVTPKCSNMVVLGQGFVSCCQRRCPAAKKVIAKQDGSGVGWYHMFSLEATVDVPAMNHAEQLKVDCPKGWAGSMAFLCNQGTLSVVGQGSTCAAAVPNWSQWHSFPGFTADSPLTLPPTAPPTTTVPPKPTVAWWTTTTPAPAKPPVPPEA